MRFFLLSIGFLLALLSTGATVLAQPVGGLSFQTGEVKGIEGLFLQHRTCAYDYAFLNFSKQEGAVFMRSDNWNGRYHVASLGKAIVAIGILKLAEQGRLKLEDPVSIHLPALEMPNEWNATDPVRIAHLLEHSAGLDDMHFNEYFLYGDSKIPLGTALARNPASKRIRWRPGTRSAYSNLGYAIAGHVIEAIVKEEADVWLQKNVLQPMGMEHSFFDRCEKNNEPVVLGCKGLHTVSEECYGYYPAVGFVSTARDMGRLMAFLVGNGSVGTDTILQAASVERMLRPETTLAAKRGWFDGDYALGVRIWGDQNFKRIGVTGFIEGHVAQMEFYPASKSGWVLMSTDVMDRSGFLSEMRAIFRSKLDQVESAISLPKTAQFPVAGSYRFKNSRNGVLDFEDNLYGRLTVEAQGSDPNERWAHSPKQEPFLLVFQRQRPVADLDEVPHFNAFAGKTSEGKDFLVVEGKYFEREDSSLGFIRISFEMYKNLAGLFVCLLPVIWYFRRRLAWVEENFRLSWMAVLPFCLGFLGYKMLISENFAALGSFGIYSATLATFSMLIPLFTVFAAVQLVRNWPFGVGKYLRLAFIPLVLGNFGLTIYLAIFGMIPFVSWNY